MDFRNIYAVDNGRHQDKVNFFSEQLEIYGKYQEYDNKSKYLKELVDFYRFYSRVYLFSGAFDFKKAVKLAKKDLLADNYKYKDSYNCENLSKLESIMDDLLLKAYDEQKELGNLYKKI